MKTYEEAVEYFNKSYLVNNKKGLDSFRGLLNILENPQNNLKIIHVGGTNGKGSTCCMLRYILTESGYKTGMFTSPHLLEVNERFSIDGVVISDLDFVRYISKIEKATNEYFNDTTTTFSFFEIITAVAFCYFYDNNVDYVLLEVGIGGRIDPTNVIENPILSIITSISMEHMDILGDTIEEITNDKCGIIKKNVPVVLYSQDKKVYNIVKEVCNKQNSELYYEENPNVYIIKDDLTGIEFSVNNSHFSYQNLKIKLLGIYQLNNTLNVLLSLSVLKKLGLNIKNQDVKKGLLKTSWNGRMEVVKNEPLIILEGAHNVDAVLILNSFFEKYLQDRKITIIIGILQGKEYKKIINLISKNASKIIITKPSFYKKAVDPENIYDSLINKNDNIIIEHDYKKAIDMALELSAKNDVICCTGSLYLVGDAKRYLKNKQVSNNK